MPSRRVERLRRGYAAFNAGDVPALLDQVGPDFVAQDRAEVPDPRTHRGPEGAAAALASARAEFDDYRVDPEEFIEVGDHVVVVARQTGRGHNSGVEVSGPIVHMWGFRGDEVILLRGFSEREEAVAAARAAGRSS